MFRFSLFFIASLLISSQAISAVKWNNPNSSEIKLWNTGKQFSFVLPQDVYDKFREVPTQTAEQFCTSGSKAPVFRLEALMKASVPSKISGYNSRMDNTDNVIGARQTQKYVQELSEVVTSAWALEDKTRINLSLEALSYWAENNALLDTYSCINSDGKMKDNCTAWKRKDGQDRSKSMDWNTAQMHLNHIAYSYYFGLSHFLPEDERHQKIQRWLITSFERNKKPYDVSFGLDLGWNWPQILNEQLRGKNPKPLLNSIITKLDKIVLNDGSFKNRTTRGNRALWYHTSALAESYLTLEMARLHKVQIPKSLEQKLKKSVSIFLNGFANHSYMDKWAKEGYRSIYEPGHQIFHDTLDLPGYNSWFFIFMYRYPNSSLTKKLETHLQKLMDVGRRDNLIGFGFGCVYATLYSHRSSDDVFKNPKTENYASQKIETQSWLAIFDNSLNTKVYSKSNDSITLVPSPFKFIEMQKPKFLKGNDANETKIVIRGKFELEGYSRKSEENIVGVKEALFNNFDLLVSAIQNGQNQYLALKIGDFGIPNFENFIKQAHQQCNVRYPFKPDDWLILPVTTKFRHETEAVTNCIPGFLKDIDQELWRAYSFLLRSVHSVDNYLDTVKPTIVN